VAWDARRGGSGGRNQARVGRSIVVLATVLAGAGAAAPAAAAPAAATATTSPAHSTVTQPTPPVTAAAFAIEPRGTAPADGDGLIPNALTPTGQAPGPPSHCDRTFASAKGATSATVNAAIASAENSLTKPEVICLAGTFTRPIHIWGKYTSSLLTIAAEPGHAAALKLGAVQPSDVSPTDFDGSTAGGVSIADSRGVEIEGLNVSGYHATGEAYTPTGILVEVRGDAGHQSACFLHGDNACTDIYIVDDTVANIANTADENPHVKRYCNDSNVGAYGIAALSYGHEDAHALQHLVIEGDTVDHTRTGQSETVTVNGDITDFLEARDTVYDADNIGMDAIGWEQGTDQARHGLITGNTVANIDTWGNASYGHWTGTTCANLPENAAGIYDDGGSYVWIDHNTVWNSDQGIDLDVETPHRSTDHILVTSNTVLDQKGTALGSPSHGTNPPGVPGTSSVAGHAFEAFYVDAFGGGSTIRDVYAHGNTFRNESQYYGATSVQATPVVDIAGNWGSVMLWGNAVEGQGSSDRLNALFEVDNQPVASTAVSVDCNEYAALTASASTGNFVRPDGTSYVTLAAWQKGNGHRWDAESTTDVAPSGCPAATP
jgi:hypothetical protein